MKRRTARARAHACVLDKPFALHVSGAPGERHFLAPPLLCRANDLCTPLNADCSCRLLVVRLCSEALNQLQKEVCKAQV